jgi:hypothetical protein
VPARGARGRRALCGARRLDLPQLFQAQADGALRARVAACELRHGHLRFELGHEVLVLRLGPGLAEVGGQALAAPLALDLALHEVDRGIERAQRARLRVRAVLGVCLAGDGVHAVGECADDGQCGIELHGVFSRLSGLSVVP